MPGSRRPVSTRHLRFATHERPPSSAKGRNVLLIYLTIALIGLVICVRQLSPRGPVVPVPSSSPILERAAVFVNSGLAILCLAGVLVVVARRGPTEPVFVAVSLVSLFIVASPLILWRSRWRRFAEGAAVAVLGVVMILSGFSFAPAVLPFALVMLIGAVQGLRARQTYLGTGSG